MISALPTPRQLEFQDWEFGLFIHFGIRTFFEGYRDWDGKPMEPAGFDPSELDCGQWARTAREAGMRYIVMTAKHHDGFALWPSQYTDFSVASSPWKDGMGDVVREFTDACRAEGLKIGLYYSPMDAAGKTYDDPKAYDDYFIAQISEILTGYGQIDMLWFDGCGSEGHTYDWPRIMGEVRRMQTNLLLFNMGDLDYRWVGNEAGIAPIPCWNTVEQVPFSVQTDAPEILPRPQWLPAECDCTMRESNWFYSDADAHTVKSLEQLMGLYYYSVGRGCNLLLNIGPDRRGLLPEPDRTRLLEFGAEIQRRFAGTPIASLAEFQREERRWEATLPQPTLIDHAVLQEDLLHGERVRRFRLSVAPAHSGPISVWEGRNIGHKAICRFPAISANRVILEVLEADATPILRRMEWHFVGEKA